MGEYFHPHRLLGCSKVHLDISLDMPSILGECVSVDREALNFHVSVVIIHRR